MCVCKCERCKYNSYLLRIKYVPSLYVSSFHIASKNKASAQLMLYPICHSSSKTLLHLLRQGWPTTPASGAGLYEATVGKSNVLFVILSANVV
jgi:hypothetical protein